MDFKQWLKKSIFNSAAFGMGALIGGALGINAGFIFATVYWFFPWGTP